MKHSLYLLIVLALLFNNMCSERPLLKQSDSGAYIQVTSLNTADAEIEAEQKWYQPDKVKYATIIASATATAVYMCNPTLRSLSWLKSAGLALLAYADDVNARRGGGGFGSSSRRSSGGGFGSSSRRSGGKGFSSSSRKSGGSASRKSIKSHTGSKSSSFSKKAKSTHKSRGSISKKSIKSRTVSKSSLLTKPANDNVLTLTLGKDERSKFGVENKIRYLQRKAREGKLDKITKKPSRNPALTRKARALYAEKYPELDMTKIDMDHKQDLQLGGKDTLRNIAPLDRSVNRKIGAQISHYEGKHIDRVRVIPPKAKPANDNVIGVKMNKDTSSKTEGKSSMRSFQQAVKEGRFVVTKNSSKNSAVTNKIGGTYTEKYPKQNMSNIDWGHRQDLRLDGRDKGSEAQIQQAIKDMPVGTIIRVPYNYLDE